MNSNQNRTSEAQPQNPTQPPNSKNTPKYRGKPNISAKEFIKCFNCGENGHRKTECKQPVNKKLVEEWQKYVKATKDGDYSLPRPKTSAANTLRNTSNNSKICELGHNDPHYFEYAESDLEEDPQPKPASTTLFLSSNTTELQNKKKTDDSPLEIDITVNGTNFEAMLDTGSALSCISEEAFRLLNPRPLIIEWPYKEKVISVTGNYVTPKYITSPLEIQIEDDTYNFEFAIMKNCCRPIILGMDFIKRSNVVKYIVEHIKSFQNNCNSTDSNTNENPQKNSVFSSKLTPQKIQAFAANDYVIQPFRSKDLALRFSTLKKKHFLTNSALTTKDKDISFCDTTMCPDSQYKTFRFTNDSNEYKKIPVHSLVCELSISEDIPNIPSAALRFKTSKSLRPPNYKQKSLSNIDNGTLINDIKRIGIELFSRRVSDVLRIHRSNRQYFF